ncbi:MAG: sugar kinase [Firmicutes bacterium HGW-Firmicutes-1]|jgi:NAD kinase|nr:MAG: sugar kinase [Firmicutes bacterium HGW-Firmicutes-1]
MNNVSQKYILVKRNTRLQDLIIKYNTVDQAKFYIEHMGIDFDDYLMEDKVYQLALKSCQEILIKLGRVQVLSREYVPNYLFDEKDIIIVLGQDGLVANTLKYLQGQPVVAINPDSNRWDGILLPFKVKDIQKILNDLTQGRRTIKEISMAQAVLNNGQILYGVNDLFIGQRTHVSARYSLRVGHNEEEQSSSGIIVSTGLGSTGWLKSVVAGAARTMDVFMNMKTESSVLDTRLPWDTDELIFTVREPYPSKRTGTNIVFGKINHKTPLIIQSQMPENGCIFSDGIEEDYLEFNSGVEAKIQVANKKGQLVV